MAEHTKPLFWRRALWSDSKSKSTSALLKRGSNPIMGSAIGNTRQNARQNAGNGGADPAYVSYETLASRVEELELELSRREILQEMKQKQWRDRMQDLEEQVEYLQAENKRLVYDMDENRSDEKMEEPKIEKPTSNGLESVIEDSKIELEKVTKLDNYQIERYSRQLLLADGFGVEGQCKLLSSSVLVVGAGGIGSTVLLYLAASGIGRISIADLDEVDRSNLHRQIIHKDSNIGVHKAKSACQAIKDLNPTIQCVSVEETMTHENILELVSQHDIVVDATDNPRTRYLINDACVLANKPLVSGSAMGTEGQLTVYNKNDGGCYRCLYPKPDVSEGNKSCSDNGVLGPVPGLIGILQTVEVLKILTGIGTPMHNRLLMYDSLGCSFMSIKKPPRKRKCPMCGPDATIKSMEDSHELSKEARGPAELVQGGQNVCVRPLPDLPEELDISCKEFDELKKSGEFYVLVDVRAKQQFEMCALDGAVNMPLDKLRGEVGRINVRQIAELSEGEKPIFCICRRGIYSSEATRLLNDIAKYNPQLHSVRNIRGGLEAWSKEVDSAFPIY